MPRKLSRTLPFWTPNTVEDALRYIVEIVPLLRQMVDAHNLSTGTVSTAISDDAVLTLEYLVWPVDASGGPVTVTLPSASQNTMPVKVKKIDSSGNNVTVAADGSDNIDGAATYVLSTQYQFVSLCPNEIDTWWAVGKG